MNIRVNLTRSETLYCPDDCTLWELQQVIQKEFPDCVVTFDALPDKLPENWPSLKPSLVYQRCVDPPRLVRVE